MTSILVPPMSMPMRIRSLAASALSAAPRAAARAAPPRAVPDCPDSNVMAPPRHVVHEPSRRPPAAARRRPPRMTARAASAGSSARNSITVAAGSGGGVARGLNHTARIPAACAPRTSAAQESPTITASAAAQPSRSSAIAKIPGSGFDRPASSDTTSTSTYGSSPQCRSLSCCSSSRLFETMPTRACPCTRARSCAAPATGWRTRRYPSR